MSSNAATSSVNDNLPNTLEAAQREMQAVRQNITRLRLELLRRIGVFNGWGRYVVHHGPAAQEVPDVGVVNIDESVNLEGPQVVPSCPEKRKRKYTMKVKGCAHNNGVPALKKKRREYIQVVPNVLTEIKIKITKRKRKQESEEAGLHAKRPKLSQQSHI